MSKNGVFTADGILQAAQERMEKAKIERDAPDGERSMAKAVAIFAAYTGIALSEDNGWRFMACLKMAREIQGEFNVDDYVDLSAYNGLLGESISRAISSGTSLKTENVGRFGEV